MAKPTLQDVPLYLDLANDSQQVLLIQVFPPSNLLTITGRLLGLQPADVEGAYWITGIELTLHLPEEIHPRPLHFGSEPYNYYTAVEDDCLLIHAPLTEGAVKCMMTATPQKGYFTTITEGMPIHLRIHLSDDGIGVDRLSVSKTVSSRVIPA